MKGYFQSFTHLGLLFKVVIKNSSRSMPVESVYSRLGSKTYTYAWNYILDVQGIGSMSEIRTLIRLNIN